MPGRLRRRRIVYILPVQPIKKEPVGLFLLAADGMRAQGSSNAQSLATTARCLYPAGAPFGRKKKAPLGRLALGLIVVTISSPIGIVRCGTAVRFELAMKHGVVLFAHSAGRCGCLLLVGFV